MLLAHTLIFEIVAVRSRDLLQFVEVGCRKLWSADVLNRERHDLMLESEGVVVHLVKVQEEVLARFLAFSITQAKGAARLVVVVRTTLALEHCDVVLMSIHQYTKTYLLTLT